MDGTAEEREQSLDETYERMKIKLVDERKEYFAKLQELEMITEKISKRYDDGIRGVEDKRREEVYGDLWNSFTMVVNSHTMAQVFRLAVRLMEELEYLYEADYRNTKNLIRVERLLPDKVRADVERTIESYQKHIENRLMTEKDKAVSGFLWDTFVDDDRGNETNHTEKRKEGNESEPSQNDNKMNGQGKSPSPTQPAILTVFTADEVASVIKGFILAYVKGTIKVDWPGVETIIRAWRDDGKHLTQAEAQQKDLEGKWRTREWMGIVAGTTQSTQEELEKTTELLFQEILALRNGGRIEGEFLEFKPEQKMELERKLNAFNSLDASNNLV